MKHPITVENLGMRDLAEAVGNLDYLCLTEFFSYLEAKLTKDSVSDFTKERYQLSYSLKDLASTIGNAARKSKELTKIKKKG